MKTKLLALLVLALTGVAQADAPKVIIISPADLVTAWKGYAKARTAGEYSVVNASDIYAEHPYTTGEAGKPRNPAESIHAFIRSKAAEGVGYFMLGGAWFDAQDLEKKVYFQGTETALGLNNAIPGVYQYAYNDSPAPSDLFYACHDDAEGYPWDANGDGKYLNDVNYEGVIVGDKFNGTGKILNYNLRPDVVVSRVSLKSATGMDLWGVTINEGSTNLVAMVNAFSNKVAVAESKGFAGRDKYALIAGAVNDNLYQRERKQILPLFEREYEYYDGLPNFGDPAHGNTGNATTELLVRRRLRDQIATVRPVAQADILSSGGWARRYKSFKEAVAGYRANSHEFDMMYSHGLISGGEVWGLSVGGQFLHPGDFGTMTGLNLFADYAGPCFGGVPDNSFTRNGRTYADFSCVEAMIANPRGGAVAAVGNSRGGIYEGSYTVDFDNDFSWKLANRMLVNFIQENTTVGDAWKNTITSYVDDKTMVNGTHVLIIAQEMLYGDPLVKLPAVAEGLAFQKGMSYVGYEGQTNNVVSLTITEASGMLTNQAPLKVMNGIRTSGSSLVFSKGEGGIGGAGVVFEGDTKGTLTLKRNDACYLGALTNAYLIIAGNNKKIDLDYCDLDGSYNAISFENGATAITIYSTTRGVLKKNENALKLTEGTSVELATWDAFGDTQGSINIAGLNTELVIGPNRCYPERNGRGESLNAEIKYMSAKDLSLTVRVAKGGLFTPLSPLVPIKTTRGMTKTYTYTTEYVVDSYDGLGGTVTVPAKAKLTLKDIPLAGTEKLTVEKDATLVLPEGASLDELVSTGMAYLKAGSLIAYGDGAPTALEEDKTVDGSLYVQKYYYGTDANWLADTKVSRKNGGACEISPAAKDIVIFAQGERFPESKTANAYFKQTTVKTIEVANSTQLYVGAGYGEASGMKGRSFTDGWSATIEAGSAIHVAGWNHTGDARTFGMDGTVTFNGEGEVHFSNWDASSYIVENVKGSAVLVIEKGVTVKPIGVVENPLSGEGTVVVTSVNQTYTIAPGWEGTFSIQDSSVLRAYEPKYEQVGEGLVKVTFVERGFKTYFIDTPVEWGKLPGDFFTGDTIEIGKEGELTLTFAMEQPVIGSGRVVTTVSPTTMLKTSLKADTWTGTFVLKGLDRGYTDMQAFNPSNYGNGKSYVELCDCSCYFPNGGSTDVPLVLAGEVDVCDGYKGATFKLAKLLGTGSFVGGKELQYEMYIDPSNASAFYGQIRFTVSNNKIVVNLPDSSPSVLKKNGYLSYTIDSDGVVQDLAVTDKATPTISALTLGGNAAVTIDKPIAGLTYTLESTPALGGEPWSTEDSKPAESDEALTLQAAPSETPSRFYRVVVSF